MRPVLLPLLPLLPLLLAMGAAQAAGKPAAAADPAVRSLAYVGRAAGDNAGADPDGIKMPFVQLTDTAIARRIDDLLFVAQTGVLAPKHPGATFAEADKETVRGLSSLDFSVARHDARVLTISFGSEGCGAYCEEGQEAFTFDLRTGRVVDVADLFTPAGRIALERQMLAARKAAYRKQIASLGGAPKAPAPGAKKPTDADADADDDTTERIELARTCLAEMDDGAAPREALEDTRMEVDPDVLLLTHGRCSNHAMRALDDVGEVALKLPYETLRAQMTDFGKALLLGEGDAAQPDSPYGQMLYGSLGGRTAIAMRLRVGSDGSVAGAYWYEKFGTPIELSGTRRGTHLELVEQLHDKNDDTHAGAKLVLDATGARVKGRWIGDRQFDVDLAP